MKDQLEGRPIAAVQEYPAGTLVAPDGRPVVAMSIYAAKPVDGRPVYAVSTLLADGQVLQAVSFWSNGILQTPDGRPVLAVTHFDAAGAVSDIGGGVPTLLGLVSLPAQNPLPENATDLHTIGTLLNTTAGSTCTLVDDDGGRVAIVEYSPDVWILYRSGASPLDYETEPQLNIIVRETLVGASNSPRDSAITIQVTNVFEAATLAALGGTFTLAEDVAAGANAGSITGKTSGSTLSLVDDAGGRVALSGTTVMRGATSLDYETATSHSFTVRETLADSPNSPRDTVLSLTVTNVTEGAALTALVLSNTDTFVAGTNPPSWKSSHDGDVIAWDSTTSSGDKHKMRFRFDGGAWTEEAYQELDSELLEVDGGFTWPLYEAAHPFVAGGLFEVQERRSRWINGIMVDEAPWSNSWSDTIDPIAIEAHRYWFFRGDSVNTGAYMTGNMLQMSANPGAGFSDIAGGKAAGSYLASSTAFSLPVTNLFDGNDTTTWHSNNTGAPWWVRVDFGADPAGWPEINSVKWMVRMSGGEFYQSPTAGGVMWSDDGVFATATEWYTFTANWAGSAVGTIKEFSKP